MSSKKKVSTKTKKKFFFIVGKSEIYNDKKTWGETKWFAQSHLSGDILYAIGDIIKWCDLSYTISHQ